MTNLSKGMLVMLLTLTCAAVFAQPAADRKRMYVSSPSSVKLDRNVLSQSFNYNTGSEVAMNLSPELSFTGTVMSNIKKYDNMQTVVIRSADNMLFQITAITEKDKTISYVGRIFGSSAADGYEIKNNNGEYRLQKYEVDQIFQPCSHR